MVAYAVEVKKSLYSHVTVKIVIRTEQGLSSAYVRERLNAWLCWQLRQGDVVRLRWITW